MRKRPCIRRVGQSYEVYGRVGGVQFSRRFPLETPPAVMLAWRRQQVDERRAAQPRYRRGDIGGLVSRFLELETGRRRIDFEDLLGHWVRAMGDRPGVMLTSAAIQQQLDTWKVQGVSASSLNHRRQALRTLFARMEPGLPNPVDATKPCKLPEPERRAVPEEVVAKVFAAMPESVTKVRLQIICHTGVRHSELMRLTSDDVVDAEGGSYVYVRSGKGGLPRAVPLHAEAREAFRRLDALGGWGVFSQSSMHKSWLAACRAAGVGQHYRPYDLRHRFATRLRELGADLADVQELLGHRDVRTTRRYAPVVQAKLVPLVNALMGGADVA